MTKEILEKQVVKPTSQDRLRIGKAIRAIRQQRKIDAKTLAQMTGIDAGNLSRIEQGKYSVGLDMLSKIAHNLGCQVEITPLPEKETESITAKNKRRYKNLNLELLRPVPAFDYEYNWITAQELRMLGVNLDNVDDYNLSLLERTITFSRSVFLGNSRAIFDYGHVAGLYVLNLITNGRYINRENREIIYSVTNFICNLITDNFVKEVNAHDCEGLEDYIAEAHTYFYDLTAKWMYMNHFSKETQDLALQAATYAISTRLTMIPVGTMLEDTFEFLGEQKQDLEYNIWINE